MADQEKETRCCGCGKVIASGSDCARVAMGTFKIDDGFAEKTEWGILHRSCFNRAIGSPEAILEELRASRTRLKKAT